MSDAMLYVTEFTMPDGSKRRPIVDRVSGCRPTDCRGRSLVARSVYGRDQKPTGEIAVLYDSGSSGVSTWMADMKRVANDLRCATEDWLIGEGFHSFEWDYDSNLEKVTLALYDHVLRGESHHECLVAAAHAIADSLEISP